MQSFSPLDSLESLKTLTVHSKAVPNPLRKSERRATHPYLARVRSAMIRIFFQRNVDHTTFRPVKRTASRSPAETIINMFVPN